MTTSNDEDVDGIQKLLQSSLSPCHSPMPFHQQLRQSIRSSMLKEVSTLTLTAQAKTRKLQINKFDSTCRQVRPTQKN